LFVGRKAAVVSQHRDGREREMGCASKNPRLKGVLKRPRGAEAAWSGLMAGGPPAVTRMGGFISFYPFGFGLTFRLWILSFLVFLLKEVGNWEGTVYVEINYGP
jgi:hypothetical protein